MVFFSRLIRNKYDWLYMHAPYQNKAIRNYGNEHQSEINCIHDWRGSAQ